MTVPTYQLAFGEQVRISRGPGLGYLVMSREAILALVNQSDAGASESYRLGFLDSKVMRAREVMEYFGDRRHELSAIEKAVYEAAMALLQRYFQNGSQKEQS